MNIVSPVKGQIKELKNVNDAAFSQKMMGDGFAIIPDESIICSPISGKVSMIFPTKHALGIIGKDGVEVLIHIGIDTVELKGEGFELLVKENQIVEKGTKLVKCDFSQIKKKNYETDIIVVVTAINNYDKINLVKNGSTDVGDTVLEIK